MAEEGFTESFSVGGVVGRERLFGGFDENTKSLEASQRHPHRYALSDSTVSASSRRTNAMTSVIM
jgi:hypothetical protein